MAKKSLRDIIKKTAHSSGDEKFLKAHKVDTNKFDAPTNIDSQFHTNVDMFDRHFEHGYNPGEDEDAYDSYVKEDHPDKISKKTSHFSFAQLKEGNVESNRHSSTHNIGRMSIKKLDKTNFLKNDRALIYESSMKEVCTHYKNETLEYLNSLKDLYTTFVKNESSKTYVDLWEIKNIHRRVEDLHDDLVCRLENFEQEKKRMDAFVKSPPVNNVYESISKKLKDKEHVLSEQQSITREINRVEKGKRISENSIKDLVTKKEEGNLSKNEKKKPGALERIRQRSRKTSIDALFKAASDESIKKGSK